MIQYLEARKAELKKRGAKGFTLAELLVVVAIIAVLVAIAIPIFTSQLEKSREATDLANVRSAYATLSAAALAEDDAPANTSNTTFARTGEAGKYVYTATVTLTQKEEGWKTADAGKAVAGLESKGSPTAGGTGVVTITEDAGTQTIEYK